ncbi:hypothetical protein BT69DRAFT_1350702 [Atractiella rhizophila]|nr:hypothetical protein BT69DRAFT_1350702 [Atractiella rhizophila]
MSRITSRTSDGGYTVASSAYRPNDAPSQSSGSVSRRADGGNLEEARRIARTHWKELRSFLIQQGDGKDLANRTNARDKLTRLTRQQFQELSTDVYDELVRRTTDPAIAEPFLPLKNEFHPKRNQARQKLATLPPGRFKDLGNDVYTELDRRYPEFEEEEKQMERERMEREQQQYNGYNNDPQSPASMYPPPDSRPPYRENRDNTLTRRPAPLQVAPSAASEVLVPNKSVLVEDDGPSLPGNDEMSPQLYTASPPRYNNPLPNGLSTKNSRNLDSPDTKSKAESDYFDKLSIGRGSEASSVGGRFLGNFAAEKADDRVSKEEMEKMKSDYEFKLATLQRRFEGAEKDLEREREERRRDAEDKLNLETELRSEQQRFDDQSVSLQSLQRDLNNAQTRLAETQSQLAKARTMERDDGSISRMKRDLDAAEREKEDLRRGVEELRGEIQSLLSELRKMGEKYEELSKDRERDEEELEGVKAQLNMYKKKFEQAKTELRNIKATSQFFMNTNTPSISSDNLPASDSGGIADIHITTFQSNIDDLLSSGRSQSPSSVLGAMKNIVQTVSKIDADIVSFEATPSYRSFSPDDRDRLQNLKAKSSATLTNLMPSRYDYR